MLTVKNIYVFTICLLSATYLSAQVMINEGTNRNYTSLEDENNEFPDWVEIYNAGDDTVNLLNYSLTDKFNKPGKWKFPGVNLAPGEFKAIFCSGKNRKPVSGFKHVINTGTFVAVPGWNTHELTTPFYWDGISNLMVNTCSYSSTGYTTNSVFNQTTTSFASTIFSFQDGSPGACSAGYGNVVYHRPDMMLNGYPIGTGDFQNSPYDYPAPYGNWYWGARNQMLFLATELSEAGLTAGDITSLAFDVVTTDPNTTYDYIEIHLKMVFEDAISSTYTAVDTNNFLHTNFKISEEGETVYLFSPDQTLVSELFVHCSDLNNSTGSHPDGDTAVYLFQEATPSKSNNNATTYTDYLQALAFSVASGFYEEQVNVIISNPNVGTAVYYTLDGSDPIPTSAVYTGVPIAISTSTVLKARAFSLGELPGPVAVATYFFDVSHTTPIISVITDEENLYGPSGIFDNWQFDWERNAYVEYFDSTKQLIFTQRAGIQIDGGAGGSRSNPQHSFRVELADGVLGDGPINYPLIPNNPNRLKYSKFYLRNGSNQYLGFPYKDACQVELMARETNIYYSAWRPVSVYINGEYFGLYELREKLNAEYFETKEDADPDEIDILSVSYWYGGSLRAVTGSVDSFLIDYEAFTNLDTEVISYWNMADQYFDLTWYTDYIIGQSWIGNSDWPYNNIKIYRSDKTDYRWRFCIIDLELALAPNGWSDCYIDHIDFMLSQSSSIPYINVWLQSMQNEQYKNYFINRFADIMNTAYKHDRLIAIENNFFALTNPEMPNEYARWGDPNNIEQQMTDFSLNHFTFQTQLYLRTQQVRNHIQSNFELPNQVDLTLDIFPEGAGTIHISTITPESYPWEGVYFNGVPVRIEAIAAEGYTFLYWENNGLTYDTLNSIFQGKLNVEEVDFNAHFESLTTSVIPVSSTSNHITIYPNPAKDQLTLLSNESHAGESIEFKIMDMQGLLCKKGTIKIINNKSVIDIHSLSPSVYLLRLFFTGRESETFRFIKARP